MDTGLSWPAFRERMTGMLDLTTGSKRPFAGSRAPSIDICCAAVAVHGCTIVAIRVPMPAAAQRRVLGE